MIEEYIPLVEENINNGNLNKHHLAYLIDRIKRLKDEPQVYGTQKVKNKKGEIELYKVADKENLNTRRKSFNLPQLDK